MKLYTEEAYNPKVNAQRNLWGRTHYVDNDTLTFHRSRIVSARVAADGLLFAIVTSDALNYENTKRGFRYVVFDVFGTVVSCTSMEDAKATSQQARDDLLSYLSTFDAKAHTSTACDNALKHFNDDLAALRRKVEA